MARPVKRTWSEKLRDNKGHPTIAPATGKMCHRWGHGLMVIPAPIEVDQIMRTPGKGELVTLDEIRRKLAAKHHADFACPITTGIFAWIAAHAADEQERAGKQRVTPYWRTVKTSGELNPKYPGGIENVKARLEAEGHRIRQRGKKFYVELP